ncbi:hypothetical protein N7451_003006 [Penicillium sp. IBT 35674x]|nr:hypothetical protein N7451_003006 [Penicillium sp. IBT 35674x]
MGRVQRPPCFQCRCRKVRCDRQQDKCGNCERLQFSCSFQKQIGPVNAQAGSRVLEHPERRRGNQACVDCHREKARCSGEFPECAKCKRRQRRCRYPESGPRPDQTYEGSSALSTNQSDELEGSALPKYRTVAADRPNRTDSLVPRDELEQSINDYFQYLYPIPTYAFLHEFSIQQQFMKGMLDRNLGLSIAAVAKEVLSPGPGPSGKTYRWARKVEMDIWNQLERPSIVSLQCLLLVIHYYIHIGRFSRAYMLAGLAARGATALRLNHERPELRFIAQEIRRRVLWALNSIDGSFSVGLPEYETIPHAVIYQRLPSSENAFRDGRPTFTTSTHSPWLDSDPSSGCNLFSACVRVSKISKDIMRLTRQLALSEQPLAQLSGLVQEIQNDLWRLQADVERSFQYQVATPHLRSSDGQLALISITWHQAHCDLYRLFLADYNGAAPKIITDFIEPSLRARAVEKCQEHVQSINCIIRGVLDLSPPPALLPPYVAVCAYHATRLTLFLPCAPDLDVTIELSSAIESANVALAVLRRFFANSASAKKIIQDMQYLVELSSNGPGSIYKELGYPLPPYDQGLHRHSHLAVHSLIRQANFIDGGYEDYGGPP